MTGKYQQPGGARESARLFLQAVQPEARGTEQAELRYIAPGGDIARRFYRPPTGIEQLENDVAYLSRDYNVYFGVALRDGRGGTAEHVTRACVLWGDIDDKLYRDAPGPKEAALAALQMFRLRPSVVLNSGGGLQAYWCLAEPVDLRRQGERFCAVNRALPGAVCGPER